MTRYGAFLISTSIRLYPKRSSKHGITRSTPPFRTPALSCGCCCISRINAPISIGHKCSVSAGAASPITKRIRPQPNCRRGMTTPWQERGASTHGRHREIARARTPRLAYTV
jgi:hypothetical protein